MPAGRPTKYKPEYCEMVIEHMRTGKSLNSFAASLRTHRSVLYKWMDQFSEFRDACQTAQALSQEWFEDFAAQAMKGDLFHPDYKGRYDKYNPNMLQFLMSRRFRDYNAQQQNNHTFGKEEENTIKIAYDPSKV